jgi:uncharacterized OB-fold protein
MSRPIPRPSPTELPFYEACSRGELTLQYCRPCARFLFYPRTHCDACHNPELDWRQVSGKGRIVSYTVVRRSVSEGFTAPYIIALIDLAEGPRMMSQIIDAQPDAMATDLSVQVDFAAWSDEIKLPVFRLLTAADEERLSQPEDTEGKA